MSIEQLTIQIWIETRIRTINCFLFEPGFTPVRLFIAESFRWNISTCQGFYVPTRLERKSSPQGYRYCFRYFFVQDVNYIRCGSHPVHGVYVDAKQRTLTSFACGVEDSSTAPLVVILPDSWQENRVQTDREENATRTSMLIHIILFPRRLDLTADKPGHVTCRG